jgi:hypothetical protein
MRPPLWNGGHCFIFLSDEVEWCVGCCRALPSWAITEGFTAVFLDRWCPDLFKALPPGPPNSL